MMSKHLDTAATNRRISELIAQLREERLIPQPDFQRRLVWANRHKVAFINTILEGYPFPEIYIAAGDVDPVSGRRTELLVDGQQRLNTIVEYFEASPDLRLGPETPSYEELTEDDKRAFLEYVVVVRDLGRIPKEEIKEIFQRINSTNYALNAMEISNARFDGEMKRFAEDVSQHEFFEKHRAFSAAEIRRMSDVRFALTFIATIMSSYFNRDAELENYLRQYNDEFPHKDRLKLDIEEVFTFVESCNLNGFRRVWGKANLLTLLVETYKLQQKERLSKEVHCKRIYDFFSIIEDIEDIGTNSDPIDEYYSATRQASNDRTARVLRGKVLQQVMNGDLSLKQYLSK